MQLSEELHISSKRAMLLFYNSIVGQQLHDPRYGYQIMSDTYIVNDIKAELANGYKKKKFSQKTSIILPKRM